MPKTMFLSEDNLVHRCLRLGVRPTDRCFAMVRKLIFDRAFHGMPYDYDTINFILQGPPNR